MRLLRLFHRRGPEPVQLVQLPNGTCVVELPPRLLRKLGNIVPAERDAFLTAFFEAELQRQLPNG